MTEKQQELFTFDKFEPIKGYPELRWAGKRPFTGTSYDWAGVPSMFVYKGAIFLTGGTTYTFGSRMDDSVYLKIGDTVDMEGYLYWYEGANPHITSVTVK